MLKLKKIQENGFGGNEKHTNKHDTPNAVLN